MVGCVMDYSEENTHFVFDTPFVPNAQFTIPVQNCLNKPECKVAVVVMFALFFCPVHISFLVKRDFYHVIAIVISL